jgi:DNA helicase-2/ATP-dependent DNA helicase PcrA
MMQVDELNEEQRDAVETTEGPLLVLAGAGSGKTRVVTYRIAHLLEKGTPAESILGMTFTNKAAQEMRERVEAKTNQTVLISTFHSLGAKILRESIDALGYPRSFTIYDEQDADKLLKKCAEECYPLEKKLDIKGIRRQISEAKNALKWPDQVSDEQVSKVYQLYQDRLKEYGALDFDDLLFMTVHLFKEKQQILDFYQQKWRYLLIDEYQDTNHAQYLLISKLVEKSGNLCVVGDPDQSIYSWRGANIHNILEFEKDYEGTKVVRLEQNYRSRTNILEASNALIMHNESRYEKDLWSDKGEGEKITLHRVMDDRQEARYIFDKVCHHYQDHQIPLKNMVIFYRTNAQSRVLEDHFLQRRLPYTIIGGISFYQRKEVKDILAYLRMVQSGLDFISFARTINLPKRGIGDATLEKIRVAAYGQGLPIFDFCQSCVNGGQSLKLSKKHFEGLQSYVGAIQGLRDLITHGAPLDEIVDQAIVRSGYLGALRDDPETFEDRRENLNALIAKAKEADSDQSLEGFLEELSLKGSLDDAFDEGDKINLMTIHHGKGLEFDVTFLAGMEEELFPHINSYKKPSALEEERRLCYVGMTRAREYLYMVNCRQRHIWGAVRFQRPSRFLSEIPERFIRFEDY